MNNKSKVLFLRGLMLTLALAGSAIAQANNINVVYINGIQNTLLAAYKTGLKIEKTLKDSTNRSDTAKKSFAVSVVWNPIGWYGTAKGGDLEQDKMELFLLKTAEEKFAPDFIKIVTPFNSSTAVDKDAASRVTAYLDGILPGITPGDNSLETNNKITDQDM